MSLDLHCPHCGTQQRTADSMAGRRIRCPDCDTMFDVPLAAGQERAEEVAELAPAAAAADAAGLTALPAGPADASARPPREDRFRSPPPRPPVKHGDDGDDGGGDEDEVENLFDEERKPLAEGDMDMTPMVDVTFLLLIFFMVTAAFSLQKSIEIPKPEQTDEPSTNVMEELEESPDIVTVQIDEYNTFLVITPEWEREAPGEIDLLARLREARQGVDGMTPPSQLMVKAHAESLHKRVVTALDAGSATGFERVQLVTVEGEF